MNAQRINWDDLQLVLAIVNGGSLSGAARILNLNHATVLRRLDRFEDEIGVRLFLRHRTGYEPTPAGKEMFDGASQIEQEVLAVYRCVSGYDLRLSGTVRCATTDYLAETLLRPAISQFCVNNPEIQLELTITPQVSSLANREADVAVRPLRTPPDDLVGEQVCRMNYGVYAARSFLERCAPERDPGKLDWVAVDQSFSHVMTHQWRTERFPGVRLRARFNTLLAICSAVEEGVGVAFVPHFLTQHYSELECIADSDPDWYLDVWVLTHPDLERVGRIKEFMTEVKRCFPATV